MKIEFDCEDAGKITWQLPPSLDYLDKKGEKRLKKLLFPHIKHLHQIITVALLSGNRATVNTTLIEIHGALGRIANELARRIKAVR